MFVIKRLNFKVEFEFAYFFYKCFEVKLKKTFLIKIFKTCSKIPKLLNKV